MTMPGSTCDDVCRVIVRSPFLVRRERPRTPPWFYSIEGLDTILRVEELAGKVAAERIAQAGVGSIRGREQTAEADRAATKGLNMVAEPRDHAVRSADGTRIGFAVIGSGPAVVFVPGGMGVGADWLPVAQLMAADYTCYLMD